MPPGVLTATSTFPAPSAGDVAVHTVVDAQLTPVPALGPKATVVEPATNPVPVTVTALPPPTGPAPGLMVRTVGVAS